MNMGRIASFLGMSFLWSSALAAEPSSHLDLGKVFQGSPFIYTLLIALSFGSVALWLYSLMTLKLSEMMPEGFLNQVREQLAERRFEAALRTCQEERNFASSIIASGLAARKHGSQVMVEAMHAEGRRSGMALWQRISLLNDVAVLAPMLGLLGTVLGMFYAFYDTASVGENIGVIFDGLGVAVGTTVAGLVVAILAMFLYTSLRFRVTQLLSAIETESLALVNLIELDHPQSREAKAL